MKNFDKTGRRTHLGTHLVTHQCTHACTHHAGTAKYRAKRRRRRVIPCIFSNDRLHELLHQLMYDYDPKLCLYVYRLHDERKIRPALLMGSPFPDLFDCLRDEHGGGRFCIMIRRGKKMELSGEISIGPPLRRQSNF